MSGNAPTHERNSRARLILSVVLVLLVLLLGVLGWFIGLVLKPTGAPQHASLPKGLTWIRSIYGYGTRPEQQFGGPQHTAIGPDGTIWGTDGQHHRVLGFNPDGSLRAALVGKDLQSPGGLTVSAENEIYVADFATLLVEVFSPSGKMLRAWHTQANPLQVAVRGDRVVVSCSDGMRVYTTQGKLVAKWGQTGRKDDQINLPQGLAIGEDGTVYVADTHNKKLKAFTQAGKLLWVGPTSGLTGSSKDASAADDPSALPLQLPAGMTWDARGHLVFVDPFSFQIMVADPGQKGRIVARYGDSGTSDGLFMYPTGIAYDPARDWFVVADTSNNRLQIVRIPDSGGNALAAMRRTGTPMWICALPLLLLLLALLAALSGRRGKRVAQEALVSAGQ